MPLPTPPVPSLTQQQFDNFVALAGNYYGKLAVEYSAALKTGDRNADELRIELLVADAIIDSLDGFELTDINTCFTYDNMITMMQKIQTLLEMHFPLWNIPQVPLSSSPALFL